jgi:hypothetical protein
MNTQITSIVNDFVGKLDAIVRQQVRAELEDITAKLGTPNGVAAPVRKPPAQATVQQAKPGKRAQIKRTPALVRARVLQGKYLGALRSAVGNRRAKAKGIAKQDGVAAALKFLKAA